MKQQKLFTCQDIEHEGEAIQGFCLNLECQDSTSLFCLQCGFDPKKHTNCKNDLKGFVQIKGFITIFNEQILDLTTQLNKSYSQVKTKYEEFSKQLENMKIKLVKISDDLSQQNYKQIQDNLQMLKELYQYQNNQEEIRKQNLIGNFLQQFMNAFNYDTQYKKNDSDFGFRQKVNEITLENRIKINEIKKLKYLSSRNGRKPMKNQIKTINFQRYNQYMQHYCKFVNSMIRNLQQFHDAMNCYDRAIQLDPNFAEAYKFKGVSLQHKQFINLRIHNLQQYNDAIICYDKAIHLDPNFVKAYFNKGNSLLDKQFINSWIRNLQQFHDAIICYDKAIQLDPNYTYAYNNKQFITTQQVHQFEDTQYSTIQ